MGLVARYGLWVIGAIYFAVAVWDLGFLWACTLAALLFVMYLLEKERQKIIRRATKEEHLDGPTDEH